MTQDPEILEGYEADIWNIDKTGIFGKRYLIAALAAKESHVREERRVKEGVTLFRQLAKRRNQYSIGGQKIHIVCIILISLFYLSVVSAKTKPG